jgi:hypothetical protein
MVIDLQRKLEEKDRELSHRDKELNYLKSQIKILTNVNNQNIND